MARDDRPDGLTGFHHGGALGDIDHDGDLDLVLLDNPGLCGPHRVLLNDGAGTFTVASGRFDSGDSFFTAELFDLDGDGFLDLALGGHEWQGTATRVDWGSSRGSYSSADSLVIPPIAGYGVALDVRAEDLDGDGDRDLVVLRTGGGPGGPGFYVGRAVQFLINQGNRTFVDETATRLAGATSGSDAWMDWIHAVDVDADGDLDLCGDVDASRVVTVWSNDGTGHFVRQ